jgi:hypothetical protein
MDLAIYLFLQQLVRFGHQLAELFYHLVAGSCNVINPDMSLTATYSEHVAHDYNFGIQVSLSLWNDLVFHEVNTSCAVIH